VKESFELFATGNYSTLTLCAYMRQKGMTNSAGNPIKKGVFQNMLRNPFYHGLVPWKKKTAEKVAYYEGNHEPLMTKKLFDKVQEILDGRTQKHKSKHDYTYTKLFKCECGHYLISAAHKEHIYLECHNEECNFTTLREDRLEDQIVSYLAKYELADEFMGYAKEAIMRLSSKIREDNAGKRKAIDLRLGQIDEQLGKLNKAVLEGYFTAQEGLEQKNTLIEQKHALRQELGNAEDVKEDVLWKLTAEVLQIFNFLPCAYKELNPILKRKILNLFFLNRELKGQKLLIEAIPTLEKLKSINYLIQGQKMLLNRLHNGENPLDMGLPAIGMELNDSKVLNGGLGWT
jgi:site-specific DNA recombinase